MTVIDNNFKKGIGRRLYELRKSMGLTRDEMLDKLSIDYHLDIDEKTIRRYENGTYIPKIDNIIILSDFFGVSLDYLVYGRQTSDDNSFTWRDSLKRLNRLIFSSVLIPWREEDRASPFYGKYYFTAYDEEVSVYMERLESLAQNENYNFEVRGQEIQFDISDFDALIGDLERYTESLYPSEKRINDVLAAAHENPGAFLNERIKAIAKKRK